MSDKHRMIFWYKCVLNIASEIQISLGMLYFIWQPSVRKAKGSIDGKELCKESGGPRALSESPESAFGQMIFLLLSGPNLVDTRTVTKRNTCQR